MKGKLLDCVVEVTRRLSPGTVSGQVGQGRKDWKETIGGSGSRS